MDDELTTIAMQIILAAGDARNKASEAVDRLLADEEDAVDALIAEARADLQEAHRAQTGVIQAEAAGTKHEITLLFVHAQDTLMTITTEVNNYEKLIAAYRRLRKEIALCRS